MNYLFWYSINLYTKFGNGELITSKRWDGLRFEIRLKYDWYFKYRAALFQVAHPKSYVDQSWGKVEITNRSQQQEIEYRNKERMTIIKRKITQFKNAIVKYENEEKLKLIPNFDNPKYIRTIEKLNEYEGELKELECTSKKVG